jgi:hypothetical protein
VAGPEKGVELYCCTLFRGAGWKVYKMDQGGGVADRLMISPMGFHLWVEFKRPGKDELDPQQVAWAKDMRLRLSRASHFYAGVVGPVNSREQCREIYETYKAL